MNRAVLFTLLSLSLLSCVVVPPPQAAPTPQANTAQPAPSGIELGTTDWSQIEAGPTTMATQPVNAGQISTDGIVAPLGFRSVVQTGIQVAYGPTQNFTQIRKAFQDARVFEQIAETMNRIIVMPRVLHIQMAECGTVNAFYDPANQRIIMCYEMVAHTFETFSKSTKDQQQAATAGVYASLFIFFHEFGHAMRDILDLPVTGREEDAVDQFSTMLLIDAGSQDGVMMGAHFFGLESARYKDTKAERLPFWDEHSLEQQRFYNILCLLYGSAPEKYESLVTQGLLPKPRAQRCPSEYKNIDAAWTRLLAPHLTPEARGEGAPVARPLPQPQPRPQPTPQPVAHSNITCEVVAQKAVQLIMLQYQQQLGQLGPQQQQAIQQQLMQMYNQIIGQCQGENWSQASRQCVINSTSLAQAEVCN